MRKQSCNDDKRRGQFIDEILSDVRNTVK